MRFENKVCLVTGGGSGIGRATCLQMGAEGGIVIIADRDKQAGQETLELVLQFKNRGLAIETDIGDPEQIKNCVDTIIRQYGRVDILVNNAAMMTFDPIVDLELEQWDRLMAVNLRSVFLFCKLCLPHMQNGSIVNISSVHAHQTTANVIPYAASKGAVESFTSGMSSEYPATKTRCNSLAAGAVDTPMLWSNPNVISGKEKITGKVGRPEEIAAAICFLASDQASYINGSTLIADGGRLEIL
jgi:glucose 1-dehydrogenase